MRLWSLHPRYLDAKGIVALWREGLLAQAVLAGQTRGYRHHPQLDRFRACADPAGAIAAYLAEVCAEATRRGYHFDAGKVPAHRWQGKLDVSRGQMDYEWSHLKAKLARRDPERLESLADLTRPQAHPLFRIVPGGIADWEVVDG